MTPEGSGGDFEEAFDHGVHLLGYFELDEVTRADRHSYLEVGLDGEQSRRFRGPVASRPKCVCAKYSNCGLNAVQSQHHPWTKSSSDSPLPARS